MNNIEKKKLWIFIAVAYGVTAVMNLLMIIGLKQEIDMTSFVNVQMMYPACGVILGRIICRGEQEKLPMGGYYTVLGTTAAMMLISILSLFVHIDPIEANDTSTDVWNLISSLLIIAGSVTAFVFFLICGKEARKNAGLEITSIKWSIILIVIFVALSFARMIGSVFLEDLRSHTSENAESMMTLFMKPMTWLTLISLPFNLLLTFLAFFGEEYGWRYYLQPLMQEKMGKRLGVIVLGLVWAVWHLGIDFMYYTTEYGIQRFICQIITCVAIGVFFGYAYMKTGNIWVPVTMHFLNNNLAAVLSGEGAASMQNQVIHWSDLPLFALSMVGFLLFIFAPLYGTKQQKAPADAA